MFAPLYSLAALLALLLAVFGAGRPVVRYLRVGDAGNLAAAAWSFGAGFVLVGCVLSALAFAGLFSPLALSLVTAVGMFWGVGELACSYLAARGSLVGRVEEVIDFVECPPSPLPDLRTRKLWMLVVSLLLVGTLIAALAPPVSVEATARSLEFAKTLLLRGSLADLPLAAVRPQFCGVLYAWALFLDGPVAASLLSWFFGVLLAAATALLARSLVGRDWGWFAGSIVLLVPGVLYQLSAPLDDLLIGALVTFAFAAWWRGAEELQSPRWFLLSGSFLGAALAGKAVALVALVATAAAWCIDMVRREAYCQEVSLGAAKVAAVAAIIAAPWWAWVLGEGGQLSHVESCRPLWSELGPWLVAAIPGVLLARRLRGLHLIGATAAFYLLASALIVPQSRSFAPLVPWFAVIATWSCIELHRLPTLPRRCAEGALAAIAGIILIGTLASSIKLAPVALGWRSRNDFLRERLPVYAAADVANRVVGERALLVSDDDCSSYFNCAVLSSAGLSLPNDLPAHQVFEGLKRMRVTHLLLLSRKSPGGPESNLMVMKRSLANRHAETLLPLTQYTVTTDNGEKVGYELLMLR